MAAASPSAPPPPAVEDRSLDQFGTLDWAALAGTALMWGSSFIWIEEAIESLEPGLITFVRIALGVATLAVFPRARSPVARSDLPAVALLGLLWMALPFLLFPIAQQWIDSSLAGMINGGVPIFAAGVAAVVARGLPPARQLWGIAIGFAGIVVVGLPVIGESSATLLGVALVLLATALYGVAINIAAPLQRRYGSLPVLLRTQLFALAFTLVPGLLSLDGSSFETSGVLSLVPLGCLGTGFAFVCMATLIGRVGPSRASVTIYFVPIVAIVLGALVRDETIEPLSLVGTAMVLVGAFWVSREQRAHSGGPEAVVAPEGAGAR